MLTDKSSRTPCKILYQFEKIWLFKTTIIVTNTFENKQQCQEFVYTYGTYFRCSSQENLITVDLT